MIDVLGEPAIAWLASTGAPNWIVLVAAFTSPWRWAANLKAVPERVGAFVSGREESAE